MYGQGHFQNKIPSVAQEEGFVFTVPTLLAHNNPFSIPEDPMAFSGLRGHTRDTHTYMQAHKYTHKTKSKPFLKR